MPDIIFPNADALPEELRSFAKATADGNGVVINLVPNERLKEFRDNNVSIARERDELKSVADAVKVIFPEGFDPNKATAEITALRQTAQRVKDGELTENKAIEEVVNERTKEMRKSYEEQLRSTGAALQSIKDREAAATNQVRTMTLRERVLGVVGDDKVGVHPSAIEDVIGRAQGVFQVGDDGTLTPKVGGTVLYGSDGTTPMTMSEWVGSLKEKSPHLFRQSNGGGISPNAEQKFGGFTASQIEKMTPEQKLAAANEASRPKGY